MGAFAAARKSCCGRLVQRVDGPSLAMAKNLIPMTTPVFRRRNVANAYWWRAAPAGDKLAYRWVTQWAAHVDRRRSCASFFFPGVDRGPAKYPGRAQKPVG